MYTLSEYGRTVKKIVFFLGLFQRGDDENKIGRFFFEIYLKVTAEKIVLK